MNIYDMTCQDSFMAEFEKLAGFFTSHAPLVGGSEDLGHFKKLQEKIMAGGDVGTMRMPLRGAARNLKARELARVGNLFTLNPKSGAIDHITRHTGKGFWTMPSAPQYPLWKRAINPLRMGVTGKLMLGSLILPTIIRKLTSLDDFNENISRAVLKSAQTPNVVGMSPINYG